MAPSCSKADLGQHYSELLTVKHGVFYPKDTDPDDSLRVSTWPEQEACKQTPRPAKSSVRWRRHQHRATEMSDKEMMTTVMIKNIPVAYHRSLLVELLEDQGFRGCFDFVYLPVDFKTGLLHRYAFVNLESPRMAQVFKEWFAGFGEWGLEGDDAETAWGERHGKEQHIERYRNSPLMHHTTPDHYKPLLFKDGVEENFPPPNRMLRKPNIRCRR